MYEYSIAGLTLRCQMDLVAMGLRGFKPFEVGDGMNDGDCTLMFDADVCMSRYSATATLATSYLAEADAESEFMRSERGYLYCIKRRGERSKDVVFHIDTSSWVIETNMQVEDGVDIAILRFGIWVMFGVVLCVNDAIAIHSSAIVVSNRCVLFLGESGTGKSTHTRLWIKHIDGAKLLNDDSPIVRVVNNEVMVYGSPWSGKTPCYKSESYPLAGLCRLEQAPYNKIETLATIPAIGALLPSCPPIFAHDEVLQDRICTTVGRILRKVRAYRLACLPDEAAAQMSYKTIMAND